MAAWNCGHDALGNGVAGNNVGIECRDIRGG